MVPDSTNSRQDMELPWSVDSPESMGIPSVSLPITASYSVNPVSKERISSNSAVNVASHLYSCRTSQDSWWAANMRRVELPRMGPNSSLLFPVFLFPNSQLSSVGATGLEITECVEELTTQGSCSCGQIQEFQLWEGHKRRMC